MFGWLLAFVVAADPVNDVCNFAAVEYTNRAGKVIYKK